MVHIKDEGSHFDAPLDVVWKYNQSPDDHNRAHKHRNSEMKPISENQFQVSWEQEIEGKWVKISNRMTTLPPTGLAIEVLDGPLAGSKFFNYYTPKGNKTEVTIVGEFTSKMIPEAQLHQTVLKFLQEAFESDNSAIQEMAGKK